MTERERAGIRKTSKFILFKFIVITALFLPFFVHADFVCITDENVEFPNIVYDEPIAQAQQEMEDIESHISHVEVQALPMATPQGQVPDEGLVEMDFYITPMEEDPKFQCDEEEKVRVFDQGHNTVAQVCPKFKDAIDEYGSGQLKDGTFLKYTAKSLWGTKLFVRANCALIQPGKSGCLMPFVSVTVAENSSYNVGDRIEVPLLKGLDLENGETHDGYMEVVRKLPNLKGPRLYLGAQDSDSEALRVLKQAKPKIKFKSVQRDAADFNHGGAIESASSQESSVANVNSEDESEDKDSSSHSEINPPVENGPKDELLVKNLKKLGGNGLAAKQALCFFNRHHNKTQFESGMSGKVGIQNDRYIMISDYTKSHKRKRGFLLDRKTGEVKVVGVANAGRSEWTRSYSNSGGTKKASRGFFVTGHKHTKSDKVWKPGIKLHGLQFDINSEAYSRKIVMHKAWRSKKRAIEKFGSWNYDTRNYVDNGLVSSNKTSVSQADLESSGTGSWGCPAYHEEVWNGEEEKNNGLKDLLLGDFSGGALYYNFTEWEKDATGDGPDGLYCGEDLWI